MVDLSGMRERSNESVSLRGVTDEDADIVSVVTHELTDVVDVCGNADEERAVYAAVVRISMYAECLAEEFVVVEVKFELEEKFVVEM